jgi:hypothetical protein
LTGKTPSACNLNIVKHEQNINKTEEKTPHAI